MKEITVFEEKDIRRARDEKKEKRYFSVIDIVGILIEQSDYTKSRKYWNKLGERLRKEGNETVTNCHQLKMLAQDGKMRLTDTADTETILRLIQSIPSKKAEPIKLRLAKVGYERMQETIDPAQSINRARENRQKHGRSDGWIQQRMMGQETRNNLTDYRQNHEVKKGKEYAILTNIIHQERTGLSVKEHKKLKQLQSQNLRDHMSEAELIFTALAELSTRQISEKIKATGVDENAVSAKKGGEIAKDTRKKLEQQTGKDIVTGNSFLPSSKNQK